MKELLLILSAAAVLLAGCPLMRRADAFIARYALPPDEEEK